MTPAAKDHGRNGRGWEGKRWSRRPRLLKNRRGRQVHIGSRAMEQGFTPYGIRRVESYGIW